MMNSVGFSIFTLSLALIACHSDSPAIPPVDSISPMDAPSGPPGLELLAGDIGGFGNLDGEGAAARFTDPKGVAVDSAGNLYVADANMHTIRKVTAAGVVTTLAGMAGVLGRTDGTGAAARFFTPIGVAIDSAGDLYVADQNNHAIRKVTAAGVVTTFAGKLDEQGSTDGTGTAARFHGPSDVAVDSAGNFYVTDQFGDTIRKITAAGVVTTLAGMAEVSGSTDGTGAAARFNQPTGLAIDRADNIYVADLYTNVIRKVTTAGVVTTLAGTAGMSGNTDGTGAAARFNHPRGVAVDGAGDIYITEATNDHLRKITAGGVVTTLPNPEGSSSWLASAVEVDSTGTLYVADSGNRAIRKITAGGVVTTLAGAVGLYGSTDGTGAAARIGGDCGLAASNAGNIYVADSVNSTIRRATLTGALTTLAGSATMPGSTDGTGAAARFNYPGDVAVDSAGNLYVADVSNHVIRKVTADGVVTTLAGTAGVMGTENGTGAAARFNYPQSVAVDSAGDLYAADTGNHVIRKITAAGGVTTLAGAMGVSGSSDGTGGLARFKFPYDVAVDRTGNVYVAERLNHTIRKITAAGVVTTFAGAAGMRGSADGTGAAARFYFPSGVALDNAGNVYVGDQGNSTIRKITPAGDTSTIMGVAGMMGIRLGPEPRLAYPASLAIIGDSIVISDTYAILLFRHGAQ